jgi:hypothetical protein
MPRPGVDVTLLDTPGGAITTPIDTGVWYAAGLTERGPSNAAVQIISLDDYKRKFGGRVTYSVLYDSIEAFFREGGYLAYVGRVVGPAATSGSLNLTDAGAAVSLIATALGAGSWSSGFKVQIIAGTVSGSFIIRITDPNNLVVEDSGNLADQFEAVAWSRVSNYIRLALGPSSNDPSVQGPTAMSAGNDDRNNINDAGWQAAIDLFATELGPGQVSMPGRTTTTAHSQIITHVEQKNRVGILDLVDSPTVGTLTGNAGASRFAASFAPWVQIPGLTSGSIRTIPPSPIIAGLIARNEASLGSNHPSAGDAGISHYAIGLTQPAWTDDNRELLNLGKVNAIRNMYGSMVVYGWRSGANPNVDRNWIDFANARLYMELTAELNAASQSFIFEEIDGQQGHTIGAFHDALAGVLLDHWNAGELFGDTPDQAFNVDTSPSVNTLETLQNLELHAICYVQMAPFAEYIAIQIVKRSILEIS